MDASGAGGLMMPMDISPSAASTASQCALQDVPTSQLVPELKRRHGQLQGKSEKRIILLGAPGCGKGTQSAVLQKHFNLAHLSTGDMLREAVAAQSEVGKLVAEKMRAGDLISDDIVLSLIEGALQTLEKEGAKKGFILDGFPRTLAQAKGLDALLERLNVALDAVIYFEVDEQVLVNRVCGRRVHLPSGRVYHVTLNPPKVQDVDDVTGEPLVHRKDDNEETLRKRLQMYSSETAPLVDFYASRGILHRVDATAPMELVSSTIMAVLGDFSSALKGVFA